MPGKRVGSKGRKRRELTVKELEKWSEVPPENWPEDMWEEIWDGIWEKLVLAPFREIPIEIRRQWAEEIREEHRRSK